MVLIVAFSRVLIPCVHPLYGNVSREAHLGDKIRIANKPPLRQYFKFMRRWYHYFATSNLHNKVMTTLSPLATWQNPPPLPPPIPTVLHMSSPRHHHKERSQGTTMPRRASTQHLFLRRSCRCRGKNATTTHTYGEGWGRPQGLR